MSVSRREVGFESQGVSCSAHLFRPDDVPDPPIVVMAHGFAARACWRLPAYAEAFAEASLAAFVFDYRGFGDSGGRPRGLVDPARHREDWLAAVDHARGIDGVDGDRVGLWGTSLSGGHVLEAAARRDVDAVVAQVPFVDGLATTLYTVRQRGLGYLARATLAGAHDVVRATLGASPHRVPVAAEPGSFAVMNTPGALEGYRSLIPPDEVWANACPARVLFTTMAYRPLQRVGDIEAPVLVVEAERDRIVPPSAVHELVDRLARVEHLTLPIGHFEAYHGKAFERIVDRERAFLEAHLRA